LAIPSALLRELRNRVAVSSRNADIDPAFRYGAALIR